MRRCTRRSGINLFADDTSFYLEDRSASSLSIRLQKSVNTLSAWFNKWLLSVNPQKTALLVLRTTNMQPLNRSITLGGTDIRQVVQHKHLGVTFNDRLTWKDHVDTISTKAARKIGFLRRYVPEAPSPDSAAAYIQDLNTASTRIRFSRMEIKLQKNSSWSGSNGKWHD